MKSPEETDQELAYFIETAFEFYGYDFRHYSNASFKRRLQKAAFKYKCQHIKELSQKIIEDCSFFSSLLNDLTVTVTEMFRDPEAYEVLRNEVLPHLSTYPEIKIWSAGCAGGEEVYSLAILLMEEGLYERSFIYGTDINPAALRRAREGVFPMETVKDGVKNYVASGGKDTLSSYYKANYDTVLFDEKLKKHLLFSDHNLVSDGVFGEMQLILCRNVLIYFDRFLQNKVFGLFKESLCSGGFLCLGLKENINFSDYQKNFDEFNKVQRIYRKKF